MSRVKMVVATVGVLMVMALAGSAHAQAGGGGGGGGGRRNFDPAAMQQRMLDRIKQQLGASDDEWKVLEPKVAAVMTAQRDTRGGFFGRGGRGGPGGPGAPAQQPTTPVGKATADLQAALDNQNTPAPELAAKLKALRDARTAADADLAKAQDSLKSVLTARQEAVLVMNGMLR